MQNVLCLVAGLCFLEFKGVFLVPVDRFRIE